MKLGHDQLHGRQAGRLVDFYRDAAAVVLNGHAVVPVDHDANFIAEAHQCLVNAVVHDLENEVVEGRAVHTANVHSRPQADGFHAFQCGDVFG